MYYGGEPADWTNTPKMPREAYYGADAAKPKPPSQPQAAAPSPSTASAAVPSGGTGTRVPQTVLPGMKIVHAHPQAGVGGYQMPEVGKIGGAKGIGTMLHPSSSSGSGGAGSGKEDAKRKRDDKPAKPVSKEEAEFLARREAARQRVQARSMQSFGLG